MFGFKGRFGLASATLLACTFSPQDTQAATQCINPGAPAPLEFCVTDAGRPSVFVQQPNNARVAQYYDANSWGTVVWLNGTSTAFRYSTGYTGPTLPTAVSNTKTGVGTAANPWVITNVTNLGATGVRMTQVFRYVNGDRTIRKTFTFANNGASTFTDLRLFHGGDTLFGGDDNARSWYDATNKMVYVTNQTFSNTGYMGFYANPATPSSAYFGGLYLTGDGFAASTAQLPSTANSTFDDAGYYLQWNRASLTPGQSWSIESFEIWSPPGAVQVLSPASDYVTPGTAVTRTFRVQNLSAGPLTIALGVAATPDAWAATLQGPSSVVVASSAIVDVLVDIVVPPGALPGATQDVTLTATATTNSVAGTTRLSILQADYTIVPNPLSFGTVGVGNSADLSVTLTNGASAAAVQIGTVAAANALAAPFSIVSNTCSNTTVPAAGTCVVTVRFTPTTTAQAGDSFSFPILSPVITTQTISVSGNPAVTNYVVTTSAGAGGGISPIGHSVTSGSSTSFTFAPDTGYSIAGGTGCGGSLAGSTYTTAAITGDCTVSATFALNSYTVSTSAGTGGGISPPSSLVSHGSTTAFTVTPGAGRSIASVTGCGGSLAGSTYTTAAITGACAVSASFSLNDYPVTATAGTGGGISPPSSVVSYGSTMAFTVTPDAGHGIAAVSGCGGSLAGSTYTTAAITGACAVSASFSLNDYAVTATAGTGGGISPPSSVVSYGATTAFTVTPDTGYSIAAVSGCAGSLAGSTYTTGVITGACAVSAAFSLNDYTVTATAGTGGGISPASDLVSHGSTTSFAVTPATGYSIASVTGCSGSLAGSTFTTAAITGACAVSATFSLNEYTITASAGAGGTISPPSELVSHGSVGTFTVTPATGHGIAAVTGCGGVLSGGTYITGLITSACAVTATFSLSDYSVTATAGTGGGISPASGQVSHGSTTSFAVTVDTGYSIANVTGCGGSLSGSTFTTAAITSACAVSASFSLNDYTVTASAGAGGSMSPASIPVNHGSTAAFTVTPEVGHNIAVVSGCGGTLAGSTFTTAAITGACAVSATFTLDSYTVTAIGGANGNISPASASVDHGATTSFTLTPAAGYAVASVTGCGGSLAGSIYTTAIVEGACSVAATFGLSQPVFTPAMPATINLASTGLVTPLPTTVKPTAVDVAGTALTVTLVGGQTDFAPGAHTLTWHTVDSRGVEATVQQILHVWPIVSLGEDISLGYVAGNSGSFRISLNGMAPVYPFDVSYAVSGYLQHHDLESGSVQFVNGEVEKDVYLAITASASPGTPPQRVDVALDDVSLNRGTQRALAITLITANARATVNVRGNQEGEGRPVFTRGVNLPVTLHAEISDPNSADTHTVSWTGPSGALFTVVNGGLVLDPMSLPAGIHRFVVSVTDNGAPSTTTTLNFDVVLAAIAPVLPPDSAGWADSALPANPDYSPPTRNVLPGQAQHLESGLIEAEPGLQLALGSHVREQGAAQAQLTGAGLAGLAVDDVVNAGGVFDFSVLSLPVVGQSASITIAQTAPVGAHAVYRLYDPVTRAWRSFVAGANDAIASAPGVGAACPPPASAAYQPGLAAGNTCVRLTISDGGPNDGDRGVNGSISNLGGVAAMNEVTVTATGRGKRGGAIDPLFLVFGVTLLALRRARRRWLTVVAACALPVIASAGEGGGWYVGGQWGVARSSSSEGDMNRELAALEYDVTVDFEDTSRSAWKLFGGYQFSPYVGLQVGYTNLGEVNSRLSGNIVDVDQLLADVTRMHPHSADGVEAALTGRIPLGQRFAATARVGMLRWDSTYRAFNSQGEEFARFEDSGSDLVLGAGLAWKVTPQWDVSADFSRYDIDGETVSLISVGATWSFAAP